jgi:hypothetical protein
MGKKSAPAPQVIYQPAYPEPVLPDPVVTTETQEETTKELNEVSVRDHKVSTVQGVESPQKNILASRNFWDKEEEKVKKRLLLGGGR